MPPNENDMDIALLKQKVEELEKDLDQLNKRAFGETIAGGEIKEVRLKCQRESEKLRADFTNEFKEMRSNIKTELSALSSKIENVNVRAWKLTAAIGIVAGGTSGILNWLL